ncbi:MAG: hypothetical protein ABI702_20245 [Burkholderiales bacterium]
MRVLVLTVVSVLMLAVETAVAQQRSGDVPPPRLTPGAPPPQLSTPRRHAFGVALVIDVLTQKGPCALTTLEYRSMAGDESALTTHVAQHCRMLPFEDGAGYRVIVLHPRFKASYAATVTSQTELGSGVLEVRGLADIAPLDLSKIGTPVAHGGRMPSTLSIPALTPGQVLELLLDPTRVSELMITIVSQRRDLSDSAAALERERTRLSDEVNTVAGIPSAAPQECTPTSGGPTMDGLIACVDAISKRIRENSSIGAVLSPTPACEGKPSGWSAPEFDCVVNDINVRIGHLALIRARLSESNLLVAADQLDTEAVQLQVKIAAFERNLETIRGTLQDIQAVVDIKSVSDPAKDVLRDARRALIKKQLKARYSEVMTEVELSALASRAASAMTNDGIVDATAARITELTNYIRDELGTPSARPAVTGRIQTLRDSADAVRTRLVPVAQHVTVRTTDLNNKFADMLAAIDNVYLRVADKEIKYIELRTDEKQGTNRVVYAKVTSNETFQLYVFTGVAQPPPTAAGGVPPLRSVSAAPVFSATPANLPQNFEKTFSLELHRLWRANVVGGVVFSSLSDNQFAIGTKIVDGKVVRLPIVANEQRPSAHYLVGLNYSFVPADSFPSARQGAKRWIPGAMFGLGLESSKQFFFGLNFEPTLGVDLSAGWHWGQQTALQRSYAADDTVLPDEITTVPTRTVMRSGFYFMVGFDLNIFSRFMGAVAPQ